MGDAIDELIEEIVVDAYGDYEQLWSFRQAFEDNARFPFRGRVVGVDVDVSEVDFDGDERRGLVAVCRRAGERHSVSLVDVVPIGPLSLETRQLLDAYRRWSGTKPLALDSATKAGPWVYPRFASVKTDVGTPLALNAMGDWDPEEEYWGEPGDPVHPLCRTIIAAGVRPSFEMDQVIPGVDVDDWDTDPIVDAAELHRGGSHRGAIRVLESLLEIDNRCVPSVGFLRDFDDGLQLAPDHRFGSVTWSDWLSRPT